MNIKKIEKQLKKINQLFETIKEDGTMSAIERDLLLSYVRGLYEKIITKEKSSHKEEVVPVVSKESVTEEPKEVVEIVPPTNDIAGVVMKEVVEADQFASHPQSVAAVQEVVEVAKTAVPEEILNLF